MRECHMKDAGTKEVFGLGNWVMAAAAELKSIQNLPLRANQNCTTTTSIIQNLKNVCVSGVE